MPKKLFNGRINVGDLWIGAILSIAPTMAATMLQSLMKDFPLSLIVIVVCWASLLIRRLHDLNRPGWWALGIFIPIVNAILSIYVSWWSGTKGENVYGPAPEVLQSSRLKRILGLS